MLKTVAIFISLVALSSCALVQKRQPDKHRNADVIDQISQNFYVAGEEIVFNSTLESGNSKRALFRLETIDGERICDSKELVLDLEAGKLTPINLAVRKADCSVYRLLIEPLDPDLHTAIKEKPVKQLGLTAVSFEPNFVNCKGLECYSEIRLVADLAGEPAKSFRKIAFKLTGWVKGRENPVVSETFNAKITLDENGKGKLEKSFAVPVDVSIFDFEGELEITEVLN